MRPIGNTTLRHVDHLNRTADFGILIGKRDCWGKGYGTAATALMLDYGFNGHERQRYSYSEPALRVYGRAGFREMGRRRQAHRLGDHAYDVIHGLPGDGIQASAK